MRRVKMNLNEIVGPGKDGYTLADCYAARRVTCPVCGQLAGGNCSGGIPHKERVLLGLAKVEEERSTIKINIYRVGTTWYADRWIYSDCDGGAPLDVDEDASEDDAILAAQTMPLPVSGPRIVVRVSDVEAAL